MQRREFLAKSCAAGAASLSGGGPVGPEQAEIKRTPGESDVAYRTRLAQTRAAQKAARGPAIARQPGETDEAYPKRLLAIREAQAGAQTAASRVGSYYELRRYEIETEEQKAGFGRFASEE